MTVARVLLICGIGTIIIGKVITGMIKETTRVSLSPSIFGYIRSIQKNNEFVGGASPGDFIGIHVVHVSRFNYWKGMLLGDQVCFLFLIFKLNYQIIIYYYQIYYHIIFIIKLLFVY